MERGRNVWLLTEASQTSKPNDDVESIQFPQLRNWSIKIWSLELNIPFFFLSQIPQIISNQRKKLLHQ